VALRAVRHEYRKSDRKNRELIPGEQARISPLEFIDQNQKDNDVTFAKHTSVPVEKSKAELERMLTKHGASQRVLGTDDVRGIAFAIFTIGPKNSPSDTRQVRLQIPMPKLEEFASGRKYKQAPEAQRKAHEQACRERWRVVVLAVKAKLELVDLGISTIEREFLADIALPSGVTVGEELASKLREVYATGKVPQLLGKVVP
jgi:hypothetical protein